jgi:hypothetical protein
MSSFEHPDQVKTATSSNDFSISKLFQDAHETGVVNAIEQRPLEAAATAIGAVALGTTALYFGNAVVLDVARSIMQDADNALAKAGQLFGKEAFDGRGVPDITGESRLQIESGYRAFRASNEAYLAAKKAAVEPPLDFGSLSLPGAAMDHAIPDVAENASLKLSDLKGAEGEMIYGGPMNLSNLIR